jgi:hypothetical protein
VSIKQKTCWLEPVLAKAISLTRAVLQDTNVCGSRLVSATNDD